MTDKCAPGKKLVEGSCYTIDNLKDIAAAYNKEYNDKIRISNNKKVLLQELTGKMHKRFNCDENGNLIGDINKNDNSYTDTNTNSNTKKTSKVMKTMIMIMMLKGVLSLVLGFVLNIIWILALIYFSERIRYH